MAVLLIARFSGDIAELTRAYDRAHAMIMAAGGAEQFGELRHHCATSQDALYIVGVWHYVNGQNGVKDFDVWSFYAQHDDWPFPVRWRGTRDFGPPKFGRYPGDPPQYTGRRVDLLGRSLPAASGTIPAHAIHDYLAAGRTTSARELAAKAVVLIDPPRRVGEIVWPADGRAL